MTLLDNHLEQISLSSSAIAELQFVPPKIFTNAILHSHDITALIRDTESHERALFTLDAAKEGIQPNATKIARRSTTYGLNGAGDFTRGPNTFARGRGQRSAVASLLGGDLGEQVRRQTVKDNGDRSDVDVKVLLDGAEKLCAIYPMPGASEKISSLRLRHEVLSSSIASYEAREARQMKELTKMSKQRKKSEDSQDTDEEEGEEFSHGREALLEEPLVTEDELRKEEDEIRLLEEKKRVLEERVSGMERDLGGLLR